MRLAALLFILIPFSAPFAISEQEILREIKSLREEMKALREDRDRRFEQVDRCLEQVDRRFEQVAKRFKFIQAILIALIALSGGTPVVFEYFARKRAAREDKDAEELRKFILVLRQVAEKAPRVDKPMRQVGLI